MSHDEHTDMLARRIEAASGVDPDTTGSRQRIDLMKIAMREVIKEWLDERFRDVGRWSLRGIALAAFAALMYFILTHTGWSHR